MVRPVLIYAAEARGDTTKMLEAIEMRTVLIRILNLTPLGRKRSDNIREISNVQRINDWIEKRTGEWHAYCSE